MHDPPSGEIATTPEMRLFKLLRELEIDSMWLRSQALELWASSGFDADREMFHERLTFDGAGIITAPQRVMVQARQCATYSAAALSGRFPGGASLALRAGHSMVRHYLEADGSPGWIFSLDSEGKIADSKRDLYAHAFVIFSLSWLLRLESDHLFTNAVDKTLSFLDSSFADSLCGGYWDCLPRSGGFRQQNPHMHLFEAYIALFESTQSEEILVRCKSLCNLACRYFINEQSGALREYYDDHWNVIPAPGQGSVEPGHLYEWAWLLRRYERICGEDQSDVVRSLLCLALRAGTDQPRGRIVDEIDENGNLRSASSRLWCHAEALKALSTEIGQSEVDHLQIVEHILHRISTVYCPDSLRGGWIDHVDEHDRPISQFMPASSLYHIYFGITAVEDSIRET